MFYKIISQLVTDDSSARIEVDKDKIDIPSTSKITVFPGKKLVISGNTKIGANTVITIDEKFRGDTCIISDSEIGNNVNIWNSSMRNIKMHNGTQVLNAQIDGVNQSAETKFLLELKGGADWSKENFAQVRGAVVKHVDLNLTKPVIVPTGHSLVSKGGFNERIITIDENKGKNIPLYMELVDNNALILQSGFCHPQSHEELFDPSKFTKISMETDIPANRKVSSQDTMYINLINHKHNQENNEFPVKTKQEIERGNFNTIIFQISEEVCVIVSRT